VVRAALVAGVLGALCGPAGRRRREGRRRVTRRSTIPACRLTGVILAIAALAIPPSVFVLSGDARYARRTVGWFLLTNATLIASLWLSRIVPRLLDGRLYPAGLAHLTTMIVQGFDLALFLPPSVLAGWWYLQRREPGDLLAPVYVVFLVMQMLVLLAKIGAALSAWLALRPHRAAVVA
jgi:hypothetical protein